MAQMGDQQEAAIVRAASVQSAFSEEAEVIMPKGKDALKSGVMSKKSIDTKVETMGCYS